MSLPNYDSWKGSGAWEEEDAPECEVCGEELVEVDNGFSRVMVCVNDECSEFNKGGSWIDE